MLLYSGRAQRMRSWPLEHDLKLPLCGWEEASLDTVTVKSRMFFPNTNLPRGSLSADVRLLFRQMLRVHVPPSTPYGTLSPSRVPHSLEMWER